MDNVSESSDIFRPPTSNDVDTQEQPLLRELVGQILRARRHAAELRLVDVADLAGVSPQYLSEIERGVKDPSSEMLAAVFEAVGLSLDDLLVHAVRRHRLNSQPDTVHERSAMVLPLTTPLTQQRSPQSTSTIDPLCLAA